MTPEERAKLIAQYNTGYDEVVSALKDFPADKMTAHPLPGKWSAREIVHHLADSESTSAIRLRKLLVEDAPTIQGYDQAEFATRLNYNERDIEPALEAFRAARATTSQLFAFMSEDDWKREGHHTESGKFGVQEWLRVYAVHAHDHAAQIRKLRSAIDA
ncbi:MAG TPA: DinB family protein [Pyrinomonadaceae bacterium]|nr:DinB family protein [Pyrinomonadaceae bacterium]